MAVWHHRLNGREFEWTLGVGDGQRGLACCDSWVCKEMGTTEWLNWTELMSIELMLSNHLIFCLPLLLPSVFPSIRVFSNESALCNRWPNYWRLTFSISPSNEYSGLIYLGLADFISLQSKRLSRLLQDHNSKASILLCLAFFMVQLSHLYMTTGKTIALTRQTFVGKVMSAF